MATTLVIDDQFQRADSSFGSPGNSWTDLNGADWKISSHQLVSVATSGQGQKFACLRPVAETNAGQAVVVYTTEFSSGPGTQGSAFECPLRWTGSGATSCAYLLLVDFVSANMRIQSYVNNGAPTSLANGSFTATLNAPYVAWIGANSTDATHTNLTAKIYKAADVTTSLRTLTVTGDTTAAMQNIVGQVGMTHSTPAAQITRWQDWNWDGTNDPTLNQAGISFPLPAIAGATQTTATISFGSPSSGQAPYTVSLYRSNDPTFVPPGAGTLVATNPASPYTDTGLTAGTQYFYKFYITDSSTTPLTATSNAIGAYAPLAAAIAIGAIGDSILANRPLDSANCQGGGVNFPLALYNPIQIAGHYLEQSVPGLRQVIVNNQAVPGLTSYDWAPAVAGNLAQIGSNITAQATAISLSTGSGFSSIPTPYYAIIGTSTGQTLGPVGGATASIGSGNWELVLVTAFVGGIATVVRAQGGTTAQAWLNTSAFCAVLPPSQYAGNNSNVGTSNQLHAAIAAFNGQTSPAINYGYFFDGANDSRPGFRTPPAQYMLNTLATASAMSGNVYNLVLGYPSFVQDGADQTHDPTSQLLIGGVPGTTYGYLDAINQIIAINAAKQGDNRYYYNSCNHVTWFMGTSAATCPNLGVHDNGDGAYLMGVSIGRALGALIDGVMFSAPSSHTFIESPPRPNRFVEGRTASFQEPRAATFQEPDRERAFKEGRKNSFPESH